MATNPTNIDRLRIATPCPISWEQMTGDNRVRHCDHCDLNVYNISELSRIEAEALIASTEGRLCARLFRRADGTVLTKDCPVGLRAVRMRLSKRAAAMFAAIVGISSAAFGQQSSGNHKTSCAPHTRITRTTLGSDHEAISISGKVMDLNGSVIADAKVSIKSTDTNETKILSTNADGTFQFHSWVEGTYTVSIEVPGFRTYSGDVVGERNTSTTMDVVLEVSAMMGEVVIVEPKLVDSTRGTTIISNEMIRRLPIPK